ncbi:RCC1 and BTB domain-containing protein 1 [Camponotus floridanus]|uniref:RCC1 and BTB domain-containing protein 1 n=1 Tax=Camponotus floridanus TaxID=104421 RepID=UPI000DC6C275|nr:RCC1 and BTB domain-containing protein 1 [Camponotus floridanus]
MKDKNVYNLRYNEDDCSNTNDKHIAPDLKKIEELCGKNIKTFAHGSYFALALTEEGEVYFWKFDKYNFTERGPVKSTPIRVSGFSTKRIVNIACGDVHFLVLTTDGEVYAWEDNIRQYVNITTFNGIVRQVKHGLEKKNIVHIACGNRSNIAVTDENIIYNWGDNMDGRISIQRQHYYEYPRKIIRISDKIVKVVCGCAHMLALTNKGKIYAWGNVYGQVGVNNNLISSDPIVVKHE